MNQLHDHSMKNAPPIKRSGVMALAASIQTATRYLSQDWFGGPRPWRLATVINLQKGGTVLALLAMMIWYQNFSTIAWVYLALHGGYGMVWLLKEAAFPDSNWQVRVTIMGGMSAFFGVLFWYWMIGWVLISRGATPNYPLPENIWIALCVVLCLLGCVIMIASDAQKHFTLKLKPGLITDGMFKWIRHPNYLGEIMIYGSFALLAWHWLPVAVLTWVWLGVFAVNMVMKEARMSRHPEWAAYKKRSWWLIPLVF